MDGLIFMLLLIPVTMLILLFGIFSRTGEQREAMQSLNKRLNDLVREMHALTQQLKEKDALVKEQEAASPMPFVQPVPKAEPVKEIIIEKKETEPEVIATTPVEKNQSLEQPAEPVAARIPAPVITPVKEERDLEKFIGENVASKIGIAVLVLGISFFIKYAIDKNWLQEGGRVIVGLFSGTLLIGLAHYYRNRYRSFSSVLVGGGLTVYFISIAFAFHQYHLIGQVQAFIYMVVVSALAVALSLYYNRQELAILATIGGFITPFLVSTGENNYIALFTYLAILNTAFTALSWFKRWPAINMIALFATVVIYGGWLLLDAGEADGAFPVFNALFFGTLFYLLFMAMTIINNLRLSVPFGALQFLTLAGIHFLYYTAGIYILGNGGTRTDRGLFTLALGVFCGLLAFVFRNNQRADKNFTHLLTGLSLAFIGLTAPVWLKGNAVTLAWMGESLVLLYLYRRTTLQLLVQASFLLLVAAWVSLAINWTDYFDTRLPMPVVFNKIFITALVVAIGSKLYSVMARRLEPGTAIQQLSLEQLSFISGYVAVLAGYLSGLFEVGYQFTARITSAPVNVLFQQLYTTVFAIVLLALMKGYRRFRILGLLAWIFCYLFYLFGLSPFEAVSAAVFDKTLPEYFLLVHWGYVLLMGLFTFLVIRSLYSYAPPAWQEYKPAFTWLFSIAVIFLLSSELYHAMQWISFHQDRDWQWWANLYRKAGLSICWGVCSFAMMWLGMRYRFRQVRILSLGLFTVIIFKLFLFDIVNIPPGGKIAAFILLGILLLVVSFMYQRLKQLILEDKPTTTEHEPGNL